MSKLKRNKRSLQEIKIAKFVQDRLTREEMSNIFGGVSSGSSEGYSYGNSFPGGAGGTFPDQAVKCGCPIDCACSYTSAANCINGAGKSLGAGVVK